MSFLLISLGLPEISSEWNYVHSGAFCVILEFFILFLTFLNYPDVRRLVAASLLIISMSEWILLIPLTWELRRSLLFTFCVVYEFLVITVYFRFSSEMIDSHIFWNIGSFPCLPCTSRLFISFKVMIKTCLSPFKSLSFVSLDVPISFA